MSEMKPTPGPWELWGDANPSQVISSPAGFVAQTLGSNDEANARLIAAAPELLDALQKMLPELRGLSIVSDTAAEMLREAEAAIAKATGEQT